MIYIMQQGARHKPSGPFWTGMGWSKPEHGRLYGSEEEAEHAAYAARPSAQRPVLVVRDGTVILRLPPLRSGCTQRG